MVKDRGYGDLVCHGNSIFKTPNLDRLHVESVMLTDFHGKSDPILSKQLGHRRTTIGYGNWAVTIVQFFGWVDLESRENGGKQVWN